MSKKPRTPSCNWCGKKTEIYKIKNQGIKTIYKYICIGCGHTNNIINITLTKTHKLAKLAKPSKKIWYEKKPAINFYPGGGYLLFDFSEVFTQRGVNKANHIKSTKYIPKGYTLCKILKNHADYLSGDKDRLTTEFLKKLIRTSERCDGVPE
jgi:hypothetical protein